MMLLVTLPVWVHVTFGDLCCSTKVAIRTWEVVQWVPVEARDSFVKDYMSETNSDSKCEYFRGLLGRNLHYHRVISPPPIPAAFWLKFNQNRFMTIVLSISTSITLGTSFWTSYKIFKLESKSRSPRSNVFQSAQMS